MIALLDGTNVIYDGTGVGWTQRGKQAVEELPAVDGSALDDADIVREEGDDPHSRAAGGVGRERGRRDAVHNETLLLTGCVADGDLALLAAAPVQAHTHLGTGEVLAPANDL